MNLGQINEAYPALVKLEETDMNFSEAYKLEQLILSIQKDCEFYTKNEIRILQTYGKASEFNPTQFILEAEHVETAHKKLDELKNTESEAQITKIRIPAPEKISARHIRVLEPFVEFIFE